MSLRLCIIGGPRTGKTETSRRLGASLSIQVHHTDDLCGVLEWSESSRVVAEEWLTAPGPWIVEGVATVRALRKALEARPKVKPCDVVMYLTEPMVPTLKGQDAMAKGIAKIWAEVESRLRMLGVDVRIIKTAKEAESAA